MPQLFCQECNAPASWFCLTCGKNFCENHMDKIDKDVCWKHGEVPTS